MGAFHYAKVLLRCNGKYLSGSGMDDALIESDIFGKKTLPTVLAGGHYVRSFQAMLIVSEVLDSLLWEAFWLSHDKPPPIIESVTELRDIVGQKYRTDCNRKFEEVEESAVVLYQQFEELANGCEEKSEVLVFYRNFQRMFAVTKQMIAADRNGNWPLHVAAVQASMAILRSFDAINYLCIMVLGED